MPVCPQAAALNNVVLIGCDVGVNGSDLSKLSKIGEDLYRSKNLRILFGTLDMAMARVARRLVQVGVEEGVVTRNTALGVTGRAGISGGKPALILEEIEKLGLYEQVEKNSSVANGQPGIVVRDRVVEKILDQAFHVQERGIRLPDHGTIPDQR